MNYEHDTDHHHRLRSRHHPCHQARNNFFCVSQTSFLLVSISTHECRLPSPTLHSHRGVVLVTPTTTLSLFYFFSGIGYRPRPDAMMMFQDTHFRVWQRRSERKLGEAFWKEVFFVCLIDCCFSFCVSLAHSARAGSALTVSISYPCLVRMMAFFSANDLMDFDMVMLCAVYEMMILEIIF